MIDELSASCDQGHPAPGTHLHVRVEDGRLRACNRSFEVVRP